MNAMNTRANNALSRLQLILLHGALTKSGFRKSASKLKSEANLDSLITNFLLSRGCRNTVKFARKEGLSAKRKRKRSQFIESEAEESEADLAINTMNQSPSVSRKKQWDETDQLYRCSVCSWEWEACQCVGSADESGAILTGSDGASCYSDAESISATTDDDSSYIDASGAIQDEGEPISGLEDETTDSEAMNSGSDSQYVLSDGNDPMENRTLTRSVLQSLSDSDSSDVMVRCKAVKRARSAGLKPVDFKRKRASTRSAAVMPGRQRLRRPRI